MPSITFIDPRGVRHDVQGDDGQSVMHVAQRAGIDGIVGECGGSCACATCHVHVAEGWRMAVGPPNGPESELLDFVVDRDAGSRLSCQIRLRPALDGLVVTVAAGQG